MCETVRLPDGTAMIVCGVRHRKPPACAQCGRPSSRLCDGPPARGQKATTCSKPLCHRCAHAKGALDFCDAHADTPVSARLPL